MTNYQKKNLLKVSSTIRRLRPPTCHSLLRVWVEPLPARMRHCWGWCNPWGHTLSWTANLVTTHTSVLMLWATKLLVHRELTLFDILAVISDFLQSLSPLLNQVYYCQVLLAFCLDLIVYFLLQGLISVCFDIPVGVC